MKLIKHTTLALAVSLATTAHAGIPTFDYATVGAVGQQVQNSLRQIQQMQQHLTDVLRQAQQASFIPQDHLKNIQKMNQLMDSIKEAKKAAGSMQAYLDQFKSGDYFVNHPCFKGASTCTKQQKTAIKKQTDALIESKRRANTNYLKVLDNQQSSLVEESQKLQQIQSAMQTAPGRKAALDYNNQLLAMLNNQTLQMRAQMVAGNQAQATYYTSLQQKEVRSNARMKKTLTDGF